jgi:hypothetical protein
LCRVVKRAARALEPEQVASSLNSSRLMAAASLGS